MKTSLKRSFFITVLTVGIFLSSVGILEAWGYLESPAFGPTLPSANPSGPINYNYSFCSWYSLGVDCQGLNVGLSTFTTESTNFLMIRGCQVDDGFNSNPVCDPCGWQIYHIIVSTNDTSTPVPNTGYYVGQYSDTCQYFTNQNVVNQDAFVYSCYYPGPTTNVNFSQYDSNSNLLWTLSYTYADPPVWDYIEVSCQCANGTAWPIAWGRGAYYQIQFTIYPGATPPSLSSLYISGYGAIPSMPGPGSVGGGGNGVPGGPGSVMPPSPPYLSPPPPGGLFGGGGGAGGGISAGYDHSLCARLDGTIWAWGGNTRGQIGNGTTNQQLTPVQVSGLPYGMEAVAAGKQYSLALLAADGSVWSWGDNTHGELGVTTTPRQLRPMYSTPKGVLAEVNGNYVGPLSNVVQIAANPSGQSSYALKSDGSIWAWGDDTYGQLGSGGTNQIDAAVQVAGPGSATAIAAGCGYKLVLRFDGKVWGQGENNEGQLGNGTTNIGNPMFVSNLPPIALISCGTDHSLAVDTNGSVWVWGGNGYGQLGDGTTTSRSTPENISGISNIVAIVGGNYYTLAIDSKSRLWAWGFNGSGQLGDGTTTDEHSPELVDSSRQWLGVAAGYAHGLGAVLDSSTNPPTLRSWGNNSSGQLGDGTTTTRLAPVTLYGNFGF